jgi:ectoine hydroxylase-related dioxygenase (phytanoyl-CoA dioxygenase family)
MAAQDFGFAIEGKCLSSADCDLLVEALSQPTILRTRAGARHLMSVSPIFHIATCRPLIKIARDWLGDSAVPFRATLFEKSGQTNWLIPWHQDISLPLSAKSDALGWGPWSEKGGIVYAQAPAWALSRVIALRVHLDASMEDNGPLRVIPGSHKQGVLTDHDVAAYVACHESTSCLIPRGGVLAMRPLLIHASSKARSVEPRRVLHIEYTDSLKLGGGIELAVV